MLKDRFKNSLNVNNPKFIIAMAAIFLLLVAVMGVFYADKNSSVWLTEKKIIDTFEEQGLQLEKIENKRSEDYLLAGIIPAIYQLEDNNGFLYLYLFDDMDKRQMNNIEFVPVINIFTGVTESYHSQNVVIVYESTFNKNEVMQSEAVESYEAIQLYYQVAKEINSVVFENLNNGQTVTYYGESEHWQGTAVLKYYNNSIEDENGKLHMDTYSWESEEVKYLGDVSDITGAITVEYSHGASKGSRTGERLDQTGELQLGSTGGNGAIPATEQPVVFTLKWNDQEESFSAEVVEMSDMD